MKAAVRIHSLTLNGSGPKSLPLMEKHGKRLDGTSKARKVRDMSPLVYGSLNLREAYDRHVAGARMNKGLKRPVLHALVQFPREIRVTPQNEQKMLQMAINFINSSHGGRAVFAARLDRDETGRHTVDVFFAPRYQKSTKTHGNQDWISTSKHGKDLCHKHRDEIERRCGSFNTRPRAVGMALQAEFHDYLRRMGLKLEDRTEKAILAPDRLEPEALGAQRDKAALKIYKSALHRIAQRLEPLHDFLPPKIADLLLEIRNSEALNRSDRSDPAGVDLPGPGAGVETAQKPSEHPPGPPLRGM